MWSASVCVCRALSLLAYCAHIVAEFSKVAAIVRDIDIQLFAAIVCVQIFALESTCIQRVNQVGYVLAILAAVTLVDDGKELTTLSPASCTVFLTTQVDVVA